MKIIKAVRLSVLSLALAVTVTGCAIMGEGFHPMSSGVLATPGCVITAEDNSFTIVSGQDFQPPFQIGKDGLESMNSPLGDFLPDDRVKLYSQALAAGAKHVRVKVPGRAEPLYGVLALCEISDLGTGAATSSYRIEIPQQYIDSATGGQVSVVYETYDRQGSFYYTVHDWTMPSWVLWLSDQPLQ